MNHNTSPANGYSAVDSALSLSKETKWAGSPVQFEFFEHVEFPVDALPETLARMTDQVSDVTQTSVDAAGAVILSMISWWPPPESLSFDWLKEKAG